MASPKKSKKVPLYSTNLDIYTILREVGTTIRATLEWHMQGMPINDDNERIEADWITAEKTTKKELEKVYKEDISAVLKEYVNLQADYFWTLKGKTIDLNKNRMDDDYYNAKRYIGFLIAEKVIERCMRERNKTSPQKCFSYLCEEYIQYLISISTEEYIKIKAFFSWGYETNWNKNISTNKTNSFYFNSQNRLKCSMNNCLKMNTKELVKCLPESTVGYINKITPEMIKIIAEAKKHASDRLNMKHDEKIDEYTKLLYSKLQNIVEDNLIEQKEVLGLLEIMDLYSNIPNMFEFILRCIICSTI